MINSFTPSKLLGRISLNLFAKNFKLHTVLPVLFFLLCFVEVQAQTAANYTFTTGTTGFSLDAMTGSTQLIGAGQDDVASAVTNIGFTFTYENTTYTQFSVNTNGLIRLGSSAVSTDYTNALSDNSDNPKIMPAWDDLCTGTGGSIRYLLTGTAPNRILKIQHYGRMDATETSASNSTFQTWFYEGTNLIRFVYGTVSGTTSATIGIAGSTYTNYMAINHLTNHTAAATGGLNTITAARASGRWYLFTPQTAAWRYYMYNVNTGSSTWCAGETREVSISLLNTGTSNWTSSGPDINMSYWWVTGQGQDFNPRINITSTVNAGATVTFTPTITAPSAGSNTITFDLVSEANCWFRGNTGNCNGTGAERQNFPYVSPTQTIVARPTVTFTAQPGAAACTETDVTYTTQAGQSNYTWVLPGTSGVDYTAPSGLGTNSITFKWLTTGNKVVTVNYSNASGCYAVNPTSSTSTTVSLSPTVADLTGGAGLVCQGATTPAFVSSPGGGTWTITAGTGTASVSAGVVTGVTPGTVTVNYTVTSGSCSATKSATVTVIGTPTAPTIATSANSVCDGASVTLTAASGSLGGPSTINTGLVAYYPFYNNLNDASGNGLNLSGAGSFGNGGLQLQSGVVHSSASTAILNTDNHTIAFYVKYTTQPDNTWNTRIFGYTPAGTDRSPTIWRYWNSMGHHWQYATAGTNTPFTGVGDLAVAYNQDQWYYVVGVKNGSTFTLYTDGVQVATGTVANPKFVGNSALNFGAGTGVVLREFKIFNQSLSATEVASLGQWKWYGSSCGGTALGSGPSITVTPTTYPSTTYYLRGESACSNSACGSIDISLAWKANAGADQLSNCSDYAALSGGVSGTLPTVSATLFSQDFTGVSNGAIPSGWTRSDATRWGANASNTAGGTSPELRFIYSSGSNPTTIDANARTPQIDATGYTNLSLSFRHMVDHYVTTPTYTLSVETSLDGTTGWVSRWSISPTADVAATNVTGVSLTALNGQQFYMRFRFNGNIYALDNWYIDNITITGNQTVTPVYAWTGPVGATYTPDANAQSPTVDKIGTYTLTVTANGCTSTDQVVIAKETTKPTIASCPSNIAVNTNANTCTGTGTWTVPTWNDNCNSPSVTVPGATYMGTIGGNYYYFVAAGATLSWTDAKAEAEAKGGKLVTIESATENAYIVSSLQALGYTNNSIWIGYTDDAAYGGSEGNFLSITGVPLSYGNTTPNSYGAYANWSPAEPNNAGGENFAMLNSSNGLWNDLPNTWCSNCISGYIIEYGLFQTAGLLNNATNYPQGVTTNTYRAFDFAGNVSDPCSFTVTVSDAQSPTITTCPSTQTVAASSNCQATLPNFASITVANDNCTSSGSLVFTQSPLAGTYATYGTNTVTITVKDAANNSTTCQADFVYTAPSVLVPTSANNITCTYSGSNNGEKYLVTASNEALVSINEGSVNLGTVTATVTKHGSVPSVAPGPNGQCQVSGGNELYLPREFKITTQASYPLQTPVSVSLYFTQDELDALSNATTSASTDYQACWGTVVNDASNLMLTIKHSDNTYETKTQGGGLTISAGPFANTYKATFTVDKFSDFWLHGNGGANGSNPLPVQLISFKATAINNAYIQLRWTTALEINNDGFQIERSVDGQTWSNIGWIDGHDNSTVQNDYQYNDMYVQPNIRYYYRLKQVDNDAQFEYSDIESAILSSGISIGGVVVQPNPTTGRTQVIISTVSDVEVKVALNNILGQEVSSTSVTIQKGTNTIDEDWSMFAAGTYTVTITTENEVRSVKLVIAK